jgi:hypothetical protein
MAQKIEAKKASVKSAETVAASSLDAVTDSSDFINIHLESSVTEITPENTTAESAADTLSKIAIEGEAERPITQWTGWVQRWGKWHEARILGWCEEGTRYIVEYLERSGNIDWMFVFPNNFWQAEGGASC